MSSGRAEKAAQIRELLSTEGDAVRANTEVFNQGRYESVADLDGYEEFRSQARETKEAAIKQLPELIEQLTKSVEENGGTVYVAEDEADANRYIQGVVDNEDIETLVKSKSMTSEEIEVNDRSRSESANAFGTALGADAAKSADEQRCIVGYRFGCGRSVCHWYVTLNGGSGAHLSGSSGCVPIPSGQPVGWAAEGCAYSRFSTIGVRSSERTSSPS